MFDRSSSMSGEPLRHAKKALMRGLELLDPQDHFAVVAFNEEQIWWTGQSCKSQVAYGLQAGSVIESRESQSLMDIKHSAFSNPQ